LNNKELHQELTKCKASGKLSKELMQILEGLVKHYLMNPGFKHLTYKGEMVEAVLDELSRVWVTYNPNTPEPNPYGHFIPIIRCAAKRYMAAERNKKYNK
jgi:hypothetical protein